MYVIIQSISLLRFLGSDTARYIFLIRPNTARSRAFRQVEHDGRSRWRKHNLASHLAKSVWDETEIPTRRTESYYQDGAAILKQGFWVRNTIT